MFQNTKFQTPNQNTKHQIRSKPQTQNSKLSSAACLFYFWNIRPNFERCRTDDIMAFGVWGLELIWDLVFGIWILPFAVWSLMFGVYIIVSCPRNLMNSRFGCTRRTMWRCSSAP